MGANEKTLQRLKGMFPDYFEKFDLPEGAKEEAITVYRACKSGKCDKASFLPSYEENGYKLINPTADPKDPGQYSLSTYEKPKDVKRFACVNCDIKEPIPIAVGKTEPRHGLVQRTKERTKKKTSHADWWLYKDATPYEEFEMIDNFASYLEEYKKKGDKKA